MSRKRLCKNLQLLTFTTALWLTSVGACAQQLALKTNLLSDVLLIPSASVEYAVGERTSVGITATYNPFTVGGHKWKNWSFLPEFRYWQRRALYGLFEGIHVTVGGFNIDRVHIGGLYGRQRQGHLYGGGVTAGYHAILSDRWSLECVAGLDLIHCSYDRIASGVVEKHASSSVVLPLSSAINIVYIIK